MNKAPKQIEKIPNAVDLHTYADPAEAVISHLDLNLDVNFDSKQVTGTASYQIRMDSAATKIIFDISGLQIDSVKLQIADSFQPANFSIGDERPFMGSPLEVDLPVKPDVVVIHYRTSPDAAALQWLSPQQTLGKKRPFLFTQGQAILTRTWIPIQDSPGIRFSYNATIKVPKDLMALMSAENSQTLAQDGVYHFKMEQPIPAYLMALAVGDISFAPISDRSGVYAEPGMLAAAEYEMADLEKMIVATEAMYGPYAWGRYDLIVLPPSFPFGGMENPKLTFATPTIIAGDRSLTSLVAHELAHSWSGNLVTNATWDDFWLNEGHTVYLERRIMEKIYNKDYADMLSLLGYQDLTNTIDDIGPTNPDTDLKLSLEGRDPDDGMTDIAYEKGYLLLRTIEEKVGRDVFDRYLRKYFDAHRFQSLSTEQWVAYITFHLLDSADTDFDLHAWVYEPGIPEDHAVIKSNKFRVVDDRVKEFVRIGRLDKSNTKLWTTHEWLHFVRHIPSDLHESFYDKLDDVFDLSNSGNSEILAAWLELSIRSGYMKTHNQEQLEDFLVHVGRRKFLTPLYSALVETGERAMAKSIFLRARGNYHSVSANSIETLLAEKPNM